MKRFLLALSIITFLFSLFSSTEAQTNQTAANGKPTAPIIFPGTGCVYNWVNDTPGIGLPASGTGNIASFIAVNTGTAPVTAIITGLPANMGTNCNGTLITFSITVNPAAASPPGITAGQATGTISACAGTASASPNIQQFTVSGSNLTGNITAAAPNNFEVSLSAGSGYADSVSLVQTGGSVSSATVYVRSSAAAPAGIISGNVTLNSPGNLNSKVPVTGTVNALPTVNAVPNQTVNNGVVTTAINFTGTANTFTWTNDTPGIGLGASGTGNIPSFTAVNTGNSPVTATITATPVSAVDAYITDTANPGTITVVNTQTKLVTATIPVGNAPEGVSVSPDGSRVYVANSFSNNVSVINTTTNAVIATIPVGNFPNPISVSYDGTQVYTGNVNDGTVSVISAATNKVTATIAGFVEPFALAASPAGNLLYVINNSSTISVVNTSTNTIENTIADNDGPWKIAVSPDGKELYVTNISNSVSVINGATGSIVATIAVGPTPEGITVSPDGSRVYVGCFNAGNITVINTSTYQIINTIKVESPLGMSITPDGGTLCAVNNSAGTVSIISIDANSVIATVPVGQYPNSFGSFIGGGTGCTGIPITFAITVNPTPATVPTIAAGKATGNISACAGTASASPDIQQFTVSANNLTGNITATAPGNFEVSLSAGSGYADSVLLVPKGDSVSNVVVYVRSSASAPVGSISGNVTLSSAGLSSPQVAVAGFVNASPTLNPVPDQTVGNGAKTTAVNFSGTANTIKWVNDTPATGLAASGAGNIAPFTAVNTGTSPITATITATPTSVGYAYIANSISNSVSVINTATNTIAFTILVGADPTGLSVSPDGSRVYVANQRSNTVSVISTATNTVTSTIAISSDSPTTVAVSPDGTRLYVVNLNSNNVSVINTSTNALIASIGVGGYPVCVAVSPDGGTVYVVNSSNNISVIDAATNSVKTTIPVVSPYGICLSPDGSKLYVSVLGASDVEVISTTTNAVTATIPVAPSPAGITISPDGSRVYVSNGDSNSVTVISTATNKVTATIPVGTNSAGISASPDGALVYVANEQSNSVSVISTATNAVISTVNVGQYPVSLGNFITGGTGCSGTPVTFTITVNPLSLSPIITATGSYSSLTTVYGAPSPSSTFTVSGSNMTAGILVTAPAGYEVSTDNVSFSNTVMIGGTAVVSSVQVYVRLAATTPVGTYNGEVVLSSPGAANFTFELPTGTVTPAPLTITANNKIKVYGTPNPVLTVTYTGFVNNDGPAQLTNLPIIITAALTTSPAGLYPITVSGAGSPNYGITYFPGTLTITTDSLLLVIPNAFTPNGDGINDTWDIQNIAYYPNCTVNIFNRYGGKVFSSVGYGVPWDGRYGGANLPQGTYYYIINLQNGGRVLSGDVTIIRN